MGIFRLASQAGGFVKVGDVSGLSYRWAVIGRAGAFRGDCTVLVDGRGNFNQGNRLIRALAVITVGDGQQQLHGRGQALSRARADDAGSRHLCGLRVAPCRKLIAIKHSAACRQANWLGEVRARFGPAPDGG